jgi:MFS family permease
MNKDAREPIAPSGNKKRYWIGLVALTTLSAIISYADRTNIGIAILPMSERFNWNTSQQGLVLGSFFVGYVLTQIIGGWLADSLVLGYYSGFAVLAAATFVWSIFTIITPSAAKCGLPVVFIVRALMGLGEGFGYPAIHSLVGKWVPRAFRNSAIAFTTGGCYIGGMVALLASAPIAASPKFGWEYIFWIFGSIGLIWLIPWILMWMYLQSKHYIPAWHEGDEFSWVIFKIFLKSRSVWALLLTNFANGWCFWVFLSWLPSFYKGKFGIDLKDLGFLSTIPYISQGALSFAFGISGDWLLAKGVVSLHNLRLYSQLIAMYGSGLFLMLANYVSSTVAICSVFVTISLSFLSLSALGANMGHLDLAPNHAGTLFGLMNTASVFSGVIGVPLSGLVLRLTSNSWGCVFGLCTGILVLGSVVWILGNDQRPLDLNKPQPEIIQ